MKQSKRIRMGMVGGGQDAFIGAVHNQFSDVANTINAV
jgi:hypothetical protein